MRISILIMGLAVTFMGLLPYLAQHNLITGAAVQISEPTSLTYQVIIIALGLLIALSAIKRIFD